MTDIIGGKTVAVNRQIERFGCVESRLNRSTRRNHIARCPAIAIHGAANYRFLAGPVRFDAPYAQLLSINSTRWHMNDETTGEVTDPAETDTEEQPIKFEMSPSRLFPEWLGSTGSSLAFTTYQAGKVFLIGYNDTDHRLSVYERSFPRCMGFGADPADGSRTMWLSSLYQLWRFENFLDPGETRDGYDAVYVPVEGRTTGDVDIHDVHPIATDGPPIFVVTRFNCLATLDRRNSFVPIWKPPFIDRIAAEDRCHLNGLAVRGGKPAFVTCVSTTNIAASWREHRTNGGVVIDVDSEEIVGSGFAMPHSPRWHDGKLYILQSGTGEFGTIDLDTGKFEPMCFLPGFARGVTFVGDHAVIGVSRPRRDKAFEGLPLDDRLSAAGMTAKCMIAVVNLKTGDLEHTLEIEGVVQELYDVSVLRNVRRPMLIGFKKPDIRFMIRPGKLPAST